MGAGGGMTAMPRLAVRIGIVACLLVTLPILHVWRQGLPSDSVAGVSAVPCSSCDARHKRLSRMPTTAKETLP
jgi:hypothetical protein